MSEGIEAKREYMREYMKKWRAKNKDKDKANRERYWKNRLERLERERRAEVK